MQPESSTSCEPTPRTRSSWRADARAGRLGAWLKQLLQNAIPSQCAVCDRLQAHAVCTDCRHRFASNCPRCTTCAIDLPKGIPTHISRCSHCLRTPPPLAACVAAVDFAYPWSGLVAQFKFAQTPSLAQVLVDSMRSAPGAAALVEAADWVLPMPLTTDRLQQRGYNQAWELARRLAAPAVISWPAKTHAHTLLRVRDTPSQRGLTREARHRNVKGAFMVAPPFADRLRGRRVLLIDDVMTTGASLFEAAHTLRQAGAAEVSALVFARTPLQDQT